MSRKNIPMSATGAGFFDGKSELAQFLKQTGDIFRLGVNAKKAAAQGQPAIGSGIKSNSGAKKGNEWSQFLQMKHKQFGGKRSLGSLMKDPAIKAEYTRNKAGNKK